MGSVESGGGEIPLVRNYVVSNLGESQKYFPGSSQLLPFCILPSQKKELGFIYLVLLDSMRWCCHREGMLYSHVSTPEWDVVALQVIPQKPLCCKVRRPTVVRSNPGDGWRSHHLSQLLPT